MNVLGDSEITLVKQLARPDLKAITGTVYWPRRRLRDASAPPPRKEERCVHVGLRPNTRAAVFAPGGRMQKIGSRRSCVRPEGALPSYGQPVDGTSGSARLETLGVFCQGMPGKLLGRSS